MKKFKIIIYMQLFFVSVGTIWAQVENIPISNPVYDFLLRIETKGILEHYSLTQLPWQKHKIVSALALARQHDTLLTQFEKQTLTNFEREFNIVPAKRAVLFHSNSDTTTILSDRIISDDEKFIYHYQDAKHNVSITPLAAIEDIFNINLSPVNTITPPMTVLSVGDSRFSETHSNLLNGTLGLRVAGTLSNSLGYNLQITNTAALRGDTSLLNIKKQYANNIHLNAHNSDADFQESHVAYQQDWFYASIGRETKLWGAGLDQRLLINDISPAFDALTLAAKFKTFEYSFSHNSLLGLPVGSQTAGAFAELSPKYVAMHSFTFLPAWGEISFFETLIYSRDIDLAYLSPISFFKSLEVAQRDRDNASMGFTFVVRPIKSLQLKATWFLDDLKFSYIGSSKWNNKTAWNIAALTSLIPNTTAGIEYTRVEPYTFSHFNYQNSNTNNEILFGSTILPNSDRFSILFDYFFGGRYPVKLKYSYTRHGENIYDSQGTLIRNVGGDPLQTLRWTDEIKDNEIVSFLDGNVVKSHNLDISFGIEIVRGLSMQLAYSLVKQENAAMQNYFRIALRLFDF